MDSSPLLQYVTFSCVFHNAQAVFSLWQETGSYTIKQTRSLYTVKLWLCGLLVLSAWYVCIGQIYSVSKVLFSLLICMYWPSKTSTPSQSEIFSFCSYTNKQLDRIFHFGRVCWSWKANTYIQAERTRPLRQNFSGQYMHTYEQREKQWISCHLNVRKIVGGFQAFHSNLKFFGNEISIENFS